MGKLLSALTIAMLCSNASWATHLLGGTVSYEYLGDDQYEITLKIYRDCGPDNINETDFDDTAYLGIYSQGVLLSNPGLTNLNITLLPNDPGIPCLNIPETVCIEEGTYSIIETLPPIEGGYDIVYQRCCRPAAVVNLFIPEDMGNTFIAHVPGTDELSGFNSSPNFQNQPPSFICLNTPLTLDHSANESDGDSLVYALCNPFHGASIELPNPVTPAPPPFVNVVWETGYNWDTPIPSDPVFAIDPGTGLLTGTPTAAGKYAMGVCVTEYRNDTLISTIMRELVFNIGFCQPSIVALYDAPLDSCVGLEIDFINNSFNSDDYIWNFGVEGSVADTSTATNPTFTFPEAGFYDVTLTAMPGTACTDSLTVTVPVFEPITATFESPQLVCGNGGIVADFNGAGEFSSEATFEWTFGNSSDPTTSSQQSPDNVTYLVPGIFECLFFVQDGVCTAQHSEQIVIDPFPIAAIEPQTQFCEGAQYSFGNNSVNAQTFHWDFGTGETSSTFTPNYTFPEFGSYVVTLVVDPGQECADTNEVILEILPQDPIQLAYNYIPNSPCDTLSVLALNYTGSGHSDILWELGDGNSSILNNPQHAYQDEGYYEITITAFQDLCNLQESETFSIFYQTELIDAPIIMPNVISPNGDGVNDKFRPFFKGENELSLVPSDRDFFDYLEMSHMSIYDRWGTLIFDSGDSAAIWDGMIGSQNTSEGTYYYIVEILPKCGEQKLVLKGHFSIIRN